MDRFSHHNCTASFLLCLSIGTWKEYFERTTGILPYHIHQPKFLYPRRSTILLHWCCAEVAALLPWSNSAATLHHVDCPYYCCCNEAQTLFVGWKRVWLENCKVMMKSQRDRFVIAMRLQWICMSGTKWWIITC